VHGGGSFVGKKKVVGHVVFGWFRVMNSKGKWFSFLFFA
jgi:hypothetical protein